MSLCHLQVRFQEVPKCVLVGDFKHSQFLKHIMNGLSLSEDIADIILSCKKLNTEAHLEWC